MRYLDGISVRVGDFIWVDNESQVAYVQKVFSREEAAQFAPPLGPAILYGDFPGDEISGQILIEHALFEIDDIRLVTEEEKLQIEASIESAKKQSKILNFEGVNAFIEITDEERPSLVVRFFEKDLVVDQVSVPWIE